MSLEPVQQEALKGAHHSHLPRQQETLATVLSLTGNKPNTATVLIEDYGEVGIYLPSFFGGELAPYPKVGDTLRIKLQHGCPDHEIIEAWLEEPESV